MALMAFGALAYRATTIETGDWGSDIPYAPAFRGVQTGPAAMANTHDGQGFGSVALDPLLSHPERWPGGADELAYRASRPVFAWLVMATSFGSTTVAAWSLLAWTALGIGVMGAASLVLADHWGRRGWVPLLMFLPGVMIQWVIGGLWDSLATGLALFGFVWWLDHRDRWAVAALCLAALTRDSALVVVLALLLTAERRRMPKLCLPFAAYAGWVALVWLRLGSLPTAAHPDAIGLPPGNFAIVRSWGLMQVVSAGTILGPCPR